LVAQVDQVDQTDHISAKRLGNTIGVQNSVDQGIAYCVAKEDAVDVYDGLGVTAVCCSVLQRVAVRYYSVLQCV